MTMPPARYHADQFVFTPWGVRVSDLTDEQLLIYDPSRAPKPEPPPPAKPDPRQPGRRVDPDRRGGQVSTPRTRLLERSAG